MMLNVCPFPLWLEMPASSLDKQVLVLVRAPPSHFFMAWIKPYLVSCRLREVRRVSSVQLLS